MVRIVIPELFPNFFISFWYNFFTIIVKYE